MSADSDSKVTESAPNQNDIKELLKTTITNLAHLNLSGRVTFDTPGQFFVNGGYGEVYIGRYRYANGDQAKVAIKRLRFSLKEGETIIKVMVKELYVWSRLEHLNVLPLRGFIIDETGFPSLISDWMDNGSVLEYARKHPEYDVILHLVAGIAEGLAYLHAFPMIHSDIKSDNVLVSSAGDARICDFGITRAMNVSQVALQGNTTNGIGSPRWMAYEMLDNPFIYKKHSKESDVWALGMTIYELLAKERPYARFSIDHQVIASLIRKELPTRPASLDNWPKEQQGIWKICVSCWNTDPSQRIKIDDVVKELGALRATMDVDTLQ